MRSFIASIRPGATPLLSRTLSKVSVTASFLVLSCTLVAQTAHYAGALGSIGSGLGHPYGVAVDAIGDVYIADQNNNRILMETLANGVYTQSVIATGFSYIRSVAVDTSGNVYASQIGTPAAVYKLTLSGSTYTQSSIGAGFGAPYGLAVDAGGDVFVADAGLTGVIKLTPSGNSYIQTTIDNTLPEPYGVAVDASDNLYVSDYNTGVIYKETLTGNSYARTTVASPSGAFDVGVDGSGNLYVTDETDSLVYKETLSGGTYTQSVLLGGLTYPIGIAVSANGNVYIANTYGNQVLGLKPEVNLGSVNVASTTGAVSIAFTFDSGGTGVSEAVSTQGAPGLDFSDAGTGTCDTNGASHAYAIGDSCTVDVTFTPTLGLDQVRRRSAEEQFRSSHRNGLRFRCRPGAAGKLPPRNPECGGQRTITHLWRDGGCKRKRLHRGTGSRPGAEGDPVQPRSLHLDHGGKWPERPL
jgi:streptogramin lyase